MTKKNKKKVVPTKYRSEMPNYVKYAAYMVYEDATIEETAAAFDVSCKNIRDAIGHSIKKELPAMYYYIQQNRKRA